MGNAISSHENLRTSIETLEMRSSLRREMQRCKNSLHSLSRRRSELMAERERLSGDGKNQKDADTQKRLDAIRSELVDLDGHLAREEGRRDVLNTKVETLHAMAIGS